MATQIVMDRTGDTRHNFDAKNADALLRAEERFRELTGAGFTAAVRTSSGEPVVKRTFDPNAEETLFFPRLVVGYRRPCLAKSCATRRSVSDYFCRNAGAGREFCATVCGSSLIALTRLRDLSRAFATDTGKGKHAASNC